MTARRVTLKTWPGSAIPFPLEPGRGGTLMVQVRFTPNLQRHLDVASCEVSAGSVAAALEAVFAHNPRLRGYLLDDQGRVRQHVMIFVDAEPVADRQRLSDPLGPEAEVYVVQALSGG